MSSLRGLLENGVADTGEERVACPRCLKPWFGSRVAGRNNCPQCRGEFDAVWFFPPASRSIAASLVSAEASAPCGSHPGNAAEAACGRCGRLMCGLCRVDVDQRTLCTPCFERLAAEGALPSATTHIKDHLLRARVYAFGSLAFFYVVVLGPVALYLSVRALVERIRSGETEGRLSAVLCIVLSLMGSAASGLMVWAIATGN